MRTLVELRDNREVDPQIRRQCANDILDRAYGKPVQQTDVDVSVRPYLVIPDRRIVDALIGEDPRLIEHESANPPAQVGADE